MYNESMDYNAYDNNPRKCVVIVNRMSGNGTDANMQDLKAVFGKGYECATVDLTADVRLDDLTEYDRIVVCGGDGTLNSMINCKINPDSEFIYCPFGTLNELATGGSSKDDYLVYDTGSIKDKRFAYVCACGIFTSLGYIVKDRHKRRFKWLAYLWKVALLYRIEFIKARLKTDKIDEEGVYTLIMAIDSPKCFGFNFNRLYRLDDGVMHLLAIKSPAKKGLFPAIKLFFPLFRAFFIGFNKEYRSKNMLFTSFDKLNVTLEQKTAFCLDGERYDEEGCFDIETIRLNPPLRVISKRELKKHIKNNTAL